MGSAIVSSQVVRRVELLQHVADPALDQVALFAQRRDLGAGALRRIDPRLQAVDFGLEPAVLFRHPVLLALDAADGVHEQFDLLFEPIDRIRVRRSSLCAVPSVSCLSALSCRLRYLCTA